jgi:hypothetical protein
MVAAQCHFALFCAPKVTVSLLQISKLKSSVAPLETKIKELKKEINKLAPDSHKVVICTLPF